MALSWVIAIIIFTLIVAVVGGMVAGPIDLSDVFDDVDFL